MDAAILRALDMLRTAILRVTFETLGTGEILSLEESDGEDSGSLAGSGYDGSPETPC